MNTKREQTYLSVSAVEATTQKDCSENVDTEGNNQTDAGTGNDLDRKDTVKDGNPDNTGANSKHADTVQDNSADGDDGSGDTEQTVKNDSGKQDGGMEVDTPASDSPADICPRDAGFTSEKFKIEISDLPRKFGFAQLKKRLSVTLGLKPHKLKALPMKSFAFVCFSSEEDREKALKTINGHIWKGRALRAKKALPVADPMKRKHEDSAETAENAKKPRQDSSVPPTTRLRSCVEPLWEVPYDEQLKRKTTKAKEALRAVAFHGDIRDQFMKARKENDGMCCPLEEIISSPVMEGYRNKSEFSIGRSEDGSEIVVGFRFGLYKDGTDGVGSPSEISIISPHSKVVVESFEKYVRQSLYPPFNHRTHCGHWRQLTVRTTRGEGGTLAVAEFVVNNTTKEQMEAEKESIHKYFTEGEGKAASVSTFFFRPCSAKTSNSTSEEPYELIYGDGHIYETMLDMKFRISHSAFFQVNTAAAEVLYKCIADWCSASPTTTILDICCGTGTIGQSMAKKVAKVIGVEMCKEAIEDAKVNATLNEVTNVHYHCAKVEHVISDIIRSVSGDCVAILDPPRGGLHPSVIKSLRTCHGLNRIVYAACNPTGAKQNFIDLCRPKSRKTRGEPFKVVRAVPMDMFPSTSHFELLVLFERQPSEASSNDSD
ncbi:tRNA (uracil-5-)-methyltransferase homolog A-like isoform X2 [Babylonia areolata]|uniref:tRNA (uracil-5-)-methyltransferase homolog A-like isoform X2 n=1 Tax=Babylonia areolata TaxID=304850 RepID=UPI003FD612F7